MKQVIKVMSIMTAILIVFCVFGMRPLPAAAYSVEKAAGISDDVFARNIALPNETTAQRDLSFAHSDLASSPFTYKIKEVSDFNERKIVLFTETDQLTITGRSLHIAKFNTQTGDLRLRGIFDSLVYADKK